MTGAKKPDSGKPDISKIDAAKLWDEDDHQANMGQRAHYGFGTTDKYFEIHGLPVRMTEPRKFPERLNPKTGEWETFHDMNLMFNEARKLSEAEFNALVDGIRKAQAPADEPAVDAQPAESVLVTACRLVFDAGQLIGDYGDSAPGIGTSMDLAWPWKPCGQWSSACADSAAPKPWPWSSGSARSSRAG